MKRLLIAEGVPRERRERAKARGLRIGSELYKEVLGDLQSTLGCELAVDVCLVTDPGNGLPAGASFADYAGMIIGGSSLHAYDGIPEVTRQIDFLLAACESALPVFGSCWGLQLAAVAGGGRVAPCQAGREVGVARKLRPTAEGSQHPLLAGKGPCYDALCIHSDDITLEPAGCRVLAGNRHSRIQAAVIPLRQSQIWAVQYHPEFDPLHVAQVLELYSDELLAQAYVADAGQLGARVAQWRLLAADAGNRSAAWQIGVDGDVLQKSFRRMEIENWLRHLAGRQSA